ncbi:putative phage abortive infection protein [Pseudoduganella sp. UC29_71]|uniref:putative phage abortive infection protein n=1 Tax=Pseudoduganella sp. UC29_71 TaxID=3350174 RepID=UPI0036707B11
MTEKHASDGSERLLDEARATQTVMRLAVGLGVVFAIAVVGVYMANFGSIEADHERWGQFGDYFGGTLNPVFSFLGLVAIVVTMRLQISQLRQATEDNIRQSKRADLVQFQATFFQLLEFHNKIVGEAVIATGFGDFLRGREAFRLIVARLDSIRFRDDVSDGRGVVEIYESIYVKNQDLLAHYFRNLYHVIKFIDMNDFSDQQYYADLLRAQLSSSEATLLFYNGLSQWGVKRAKPLIERYGLLKTLPAELVLPPDLIVMYQDSAYREGYAERN